jgi:uncharacterized protein (DUF849 family)
MHSTSSSIRSGPRYKTLATAPVHRAFTTRTADQLAAAARAGVDAGAASLYLHPCDQAGKQTLHSEPCAVALRTIRASCPGVQISLSTSAGIEPDPGCRLELIAGWSCPTS